MLLLHCFLDGSRVEYTFRFSAMMQRVSMSVSSRENHTRHGAGRNISINHGAEEYICWVLHCTDILHHRKGSLPFVRLPSGAP